MVSVVIVEDEAPARLKLMEQLRAIGQTSVIGVAVNGQEAIPLVNRLLPELLLLDHRLLDMTGVDVLEKLKHQPKVIFTTAYRDAAIEAFEFGAVDYLLKPFSTERLRKAISRAANTGLAKAGDQYRPREERLAVRNGQASVLLAYSDIFFIRSREGMSEVWNGHQFFEISKSLQALENALPERRFVRLHRQYLVNFENISAVHPFFNGKVLVVLNDGAVTQLRSSRAGWQRLKQLINLG